MLNKFFSVFSQTRVLLITTVLLFAVVIFFPIPVSDERLISSEWCGFPNPFIKWDFYDDGTFYQNFILLDSSGAGTGFVDTGAWTEAERTIRVVILEEELLDRNQVLTIRPAGLGHYLWAYGDFLGDVNKSQNTILFWYQCNSS